MNDVISENNYYTHDTKLYDKNFCFKINLLNSLI